MWLHQKESIVIKTKGNEFVIVREKTRCNKDHIIICTLYNEYKYDT